MALVEPHVGHRRNILVLAYYYLPATTSGVQRAVRFAKYLPQYGYRPFVVTSSGAGTLPLTQVFHVPNVGTYKVVDPATDWMMAKIQRILPYNEQVPWTPHAIAVAEQLIRDCRISAVISTSPPTAVHLAAFWLKLRFGLKWIADFRDPLLGNPGRARRWAVPYDHLLEWCIFGYADRIMSVTDSIVERWRRRYPRWRHKFIALWNGYDPAEVFPAAAIPTRKYRTLSHIGVLYPQRHPFAILSALDRLTSRGRLDPAGIRVRFVGEIVDEDRFRSHPAVLSLQAKGCLEINSDTVSREVALNDIVDSDYLLLLDIDNLDHLGYAVPAKLFDYVLAGRPMLTATSHQSPVERIISQSGLPYCCIYHSDSAEQVESKLLDFFRLTSTPQAPNSWFLNTFNGELQVASVAGLLDGLLDT
jgi:hypothetical protein